VRQQDMDQPITVVTFDREFWEAARDEGLAIWRAYSGSQASPCRGSLLANTMTPLLHIARRPG